MALIEVSPPIWKAFSALKADEESQVFSISSVWFLPWRQSLTRPIMTSHCHMSEDVNSLNCLWLKRLKLPWCGWLRTCTTRSVFSAPAKIQQQPTQAFISWHIFYAFCSTKAFIWMTDYQHICNRKVNLFDLAVFKQAQQQPEKQHLKLYFSTPAQSGGFFTSLTVITVRRNFPRHAHPDPSIFFLSKCF